MNRVKKEKKLRGKEFPRRPMRDQNRYKAHKNASGMSNYDYEVDEKFFKECESLLKDSKGGSEEFKEGSKAIEALERIIKLLESI
jgi:hypothetical protein